MSTCLDVKVCETLARTLCAVKTGVVRVFVVVVILGLDAQRMDNFIRMDGVW